MVKVVCAKEGLATNVEALCMLRERKATRRQRKVSEPLSVADEVMDLALVYLEKSPAGSQTPEQVAQCMRFLRGLDGGVDLGLTSEKRLQIANIAPDSAVAVCVICGDLQDDHIDEILKLSKAHLRARGTASTSPRPPTI